MKIQPLSHVTLPIFLSLHPPLPEIPVNYEKFVINFLSPPPNIHPIQHIESQPGSDQSSSTIRFSIPQHPWILSCFKLWSCGNSRFWRSWGMIKSISCSHFLQLPALLHLCAHSFTFVYQHFEISGRSMWIRRPNSGSDWPIQTIGFLQVFGSDRKKLRATKYEVQPNPEQMG